MQYEFEVAEPDEDLEFVPKPQVIVAQTKSGFVKVTVLFMANSALQIDTGIAKSSMGKVKLQFTGKTLSDAYTASQTLRKVVFTFTSPKGMAGNFEFIGQKT